MMRKTANIDIRVEPELIERLDAWRAQQRVPPSRSAAVVYMLEHFLDSDATANASRNCAGKWQVSDE
jgi:metal-responsive CopG/Arc/MetJ family transcriptional regulator